MSLLEKDRIYWTSYGLLSVDLYVVTVLVYEYNFSDLPAFLNENLVL